VDESTARFQAWGQVVACGLVDLLLRVRSGSRSPGSSAGLSKMNTASGRKISALAAMDAQYAWTMITGFVLLGAGTVALGAGLASTLKYPSALIGSVLLMIAGIGLAVAGLARNDCSSKLPACAARVDSGAVSWQHQVHDNVSLIIFVVLIAAPLVFARAFGRDDRWRPLRTYSIVTGLLGFALLVLYVIASAGTWNGLAQRTFVSVLFVWIAVVGFRLSRLVAYVESGAR
jgi:hypothetical membrane protein